MFTIVIVDYGMGNLRSVQKAFETCGCNAELSRNARTVEDADALVVPGVGSFGDCVENLDRFGLKGAIGSFLKSGRSYLGICLGLQILFESSEESESSRGLGVFPGCVRRFRGNIKIPHMGWNTIRITGRDGTRCPLFRGIGDGAYFYFVHSYYPAPDEAEVIAAVTDYGGEFASAVWRDNIIATQFHPEKSQRLGLKLIKNFIDVVRGK
jgi:glutamine amidotransferase